MKIFSKVSKVLLAVAFTFGLTGSVTALAATTPSLGAAATFGIYAGTSYTNTSATTTINGDVGFSITPATDPLPLPRPSVTYPNYGPAGTYATAGANISTALTNLDSQVCTFTFTPGAVVLSTNVQHGSPIYTPGVYCIDGAVSVGVGGITLSGAGTYIFRTTPAGALDAEGSSIVALSGGASACDVFWTPNGAVTINANATFIGTVIPTSQAITLLDNVSWIGRALTSAGPVTTGYGDTITVPTCAAPVVAGRRRTVPPPPLISVTKIPTPLALPLGPGSVTYNYEVLNIGTVAMNNVTVIDNKCPLMSFLSGDVNSDLTLDLNEIWKYSCTTTLSTTTTNTVIATGAANGFIAIDTAEAIVVVGVPIIPPLIHVVKIPSTFVLPFGGGPVLYTYTVTNPGTEPLNNVSIIDNKCTGLPGRVAGHPGDLNQNNLLESNETWTFTCQTNIMQTTTNTATAEGHANGLTVLDYAFATVVVSPPLLPNTGFPPENFAMLLGALVLVSVLYYFVRRKHTV